MRKILLLIVLFGATITGVRAQVGIGTQDPHKAAQLEIKSSPEKRGLLIPRIELTDIEMTLSGTTSKSEMPNSILVFNTGTFTWGTKSFGPGYYYWDVNADGRTGKGAWVALLSGGNAKNVQNFFNTINTNSSTVVYNSASNTFDLKVGNGLRNLTDALGNPYVGLGGALATDTTIDMGGKKLKVTGLSSGTASSSIVVLGPDKELQVMSKLNIAQIGAHPTNDNGKVLTVENGVPKWIPVTGTASNSLVQAENGLKIEGGKVKLGGPLTGNTTIKTTSSQTLAIEGLQDGAGNDKLVVTDAAGILRTVTGVTTSQIVGGNLNKGKILTVDNNGVVTWTSLGSSATNTIDFSGLAGNGLVFNTTSGTLDVQAENGLKIEDDKVKLGGLLTGNTTITTASDKTLAIKGLQDGAGSDKIVVTDADGVLKTVSGVTTSQIVGGNLNKGKILTVDNNGVVTWTSLGSSATNTIDFSGLAGNGLVFNTTSGTLDVQAENGLKIEDDKVKLGGDLTEDTKIDVKNHDLTIAGLKEGAATNTLVVRDAAGVLKYVDGVSTDQIKGGTTNAGKILTVNNAGVVTWTSLGGSATNTIDFSGLAGDGLTYSTTTGKLNVVPGNGIQIDGNNKVEWGGKLTKTATIETDDNKAFVIKPGGTRTTSNVVIKDLPTGTVSDSFVVVDGDGNLKTVDPKSAAKIDYTEGPQETGRRWKVPVSSTSPAIDKPVKEMTFRVNFGTGSTKVEVTDKLGTNGNVTVIGIRLIGIDGNPNYINSNATYRYNYNPDTNGADTRDWIFIGTNQDAFSVTIKGWYFVIVEYFEN